MPESAASSPKPDPAIFLDSPSPPSCTSSLINFAQTPIPEYSRHFALLIHNLLTPTECNQLLALAESTTQPPATWSAAEINIGNGQQKLILDARNCGRIIWDDAPLAERLMARILPHLPREIVTLHGNAVAMGNGPVKRGETWRISRLNERLRFLKYTDGMYFRAHCDGSYVTPDGREVSFLTVHVYLNGGEEGSEKGNGDSGDNDASAGNSAKDDEFVLHDADPAPAQTPTNGFGSNGNHHATKDQPLIGGATRFFSCKHAGKYMDVNPQKGACLVFQHRGLLHSGEEVERGVKYTVRSDIMYEKVKE